MFFLGFSLFVERKGVLLVLVERFESGSSFCCSRKWVIEM